MRQQALLWTVGQFLTVLISQTRGQSHDFLWDGDFSWGTAGNVCVGKSALLPAGSVISAGLRSARRQFAKNDAVVLPRNCRDGAVLLVDPMQQKPAKEKHYSAAHCGNTEGQTMYTTIGYSLHIYLHNTSGARNPLVDGFNVTVTLSDCTCGKLITEDLDSIHDRCHGKPIFQLSHKDIQVGKCCKYQLKSSTKKIYTAIDFTKFKIPVDTCNINNSISISRRGDMQKMKSYCDLTGKPEFYNRKEAGEVFIRSGRNMLLTACRPNADAEFQANIYTVGKRGVPAADQVAAMDGTSCVCGRIYRKKRNSRRKRATCNAANKCLAQNCKPPPVCQCLKNNNCKTMKKCKKFCKTLCKNEAFCKKNVCNPEKFCAARSLSCRPKDCNGDACKDTKECKTLVKRCKKSKCNPKRCKLLAICGRVCTRSKNCHRPVCRSHPNCLQVLEECKKKENCNKPVCWKTEACANTATICQRKKDCAKSPCSKTNFCINKLTICKNHKNCGTQLCKNSQYCRKLIPCWKKKNCNKPICQKFPLCNTRADCNRAKDCAQRPCSKTNFCRSKLKICKDETNCPMPICKLSKHCKIFKPCWKKRNCARPECQNFPLCTKPTICVKSKHCALKPCTKTNFCKTTFKKCTVRDCKKAWCKQSMICHAPIKCRKKPESCLTKPCSKTIYCRKLLKLQKPKDCQSEKYKNSIYCHRQSKRCKKPQHCKLRQCKKSNYCQDCEKESDCAKKTCSESKICKTLTTARTPIDDRTATENAPKRWKDWPWLVSITVKGKPLCQGVLIGIKYVLTCDKCATSTKPGDYDVIVKDIVHNVADSDEQKKKVSKVKKATGQMCAGDMCLVLLELSSGVEFTADRKVAPICLACISKKLTMMNETGFLLGYGFDPSASPQIGMKDTKANIVDSSQCTGVPSVGAFCAVKRQRLTGHSCPDSTVVTDYGAPLAVRLSKKGVFVHYSLRGILCKYECGKNADVFIEAFSTGVLSWLFENMGPDYCHTPTRVPKKKTK